MASVLGLVGLARVTAYSTTKFGLVGFTEAMRAEYVRRGIGFTAICPGLVDTKLFTSAPKAPKGKSARVPPKWFLTTPEKIAKRTIRAIRRNHGVVVIQRYARLLYFIKRMSPGLLDFCHRVHLRPRRPQVAHVTAELNSHQPLPAPKPPQKDRAA
jgi:short-subunit dehydrogenase